MRKLNRLLSFSLSFSFCLSASLFLSLLLLLPLSLFLCFFFIYPIQPARIFFLLFCSSSLLLFSFLSVSVVPFVVRTRVESEWFGVCGLSWLSGGIRNHTGNQCVQGVGVSRPTNDESPRAYASGEIFAQKKTKGDADSQREKEREREK